jgi:hypothetical protein
MLNLEVGTIELFFCGDDWMEEICHCGENVDPQRLERLERLKRFEPSLILNDWNQLTRR